VRLESFLSHLDRELREQPALHPARVCFELARRVEAVVEFAGPAGEALEYDDFCRWQTSGGEDPFIDAEGRATLRIRTSHRICDWIVLDARLTRGLVVERRHTMLRSWVTDG